MGPIFISFSHKDRDYVHRLAEALRYEGFSVWIDDRIDYGTEWPKVIQRYLDECDAFIIVVSENAYESKWVQNEVTRGDRKKKPLFPLLLKGNTWLSVEATQYINVSDGSLPSEKFYERLSKYAPRNKLVETLIDDTPVAQINLAKQSFGRRAELQPSSTPKEPSKMANLQEERNIKKKTRPKHKANLLVVAIIIGVVFVSGITIVAFALSVLPSFVHVFGFGIMSTITALPSITPSPTSGASFSGIFILTSDAYNVTHVGDGSIVYYTKLSADDAMKFLRDKYAAKGYTERENFTVDSSTTFSLVFDGDPSGKAVVIQSVDLGDGSRTIAIRLEKT